MLKHLSIFAVAIAATLFFAAHSHGALPATLQDCIPGTDAEACNVWQPMQDSAVAQLTTLSGVKVLKLPCNYSASIAERASWDQRIQIDLSAATGIEFKLLCRNVDPIHYFAIYFQSGDGWYTGTFFPERTNTWNTIRISKAEFQTEGNPTGWDKLRTIRISAWKGGNQDTDLYIRDLHATGRLGEDALIVVLRGAETDERRPGRGGGDPAERLSTLLQQAHLSCVQINLQNLSPAILKQAKLVILPRQENLTEKTAKALAQYVAKGGRILTNTLTGSAFQSAERETREQALVQSIGGLVPDLLREPAAARIDSIAQLGRYDNIDQLARAIAAQTRKPELLKEALKLRQAAVASQNKREYAKALELATEAGKKMELAYAAAHRPEPAEFRAFWCHSAFGVRGMTWDEAIRTLATNGFTAVIPNMMWGGAAFYPSEYLPAGKGMDGKGPRDQIQECLDACKKYGIAMHVWKVNWYLGSATAPEFTARMRAEGRLQAGPNGEEKDWLCPSHPANRELEISSMVEVAHKYAVDGLHFDYIRYPDNDHCYCNRCRETFEKASGLNIKNWPAEVRTGPMREAWNKWRQNNITAVVKAVSERAREARPGIKISAAVFPDYINDRNTVAQDWKLWCEKRYVDFVCPMDYSTSDRRFENLVKRQREWASGLPYYPGIGLSTAGQAFGVDLVIEQILTTRKYKTHGFTIFNYGPREAAEILPLLGSGVTASRLESNSAP